MQFVTMDQDSPSPSPEPYLKPRPRPPKGPGHAAQIRVQNRRRAYLDRHPDYFKSLEHELADPLLYDALVRRFQTAEERENEGRTKGYSRVLEVDLLRGEAKLSRLAESSQESSSIPTAGPSSSSASSSSRPSLRFASSAAAMDNGSIKNGAAVDTDKRQHMSDSLGLDEYTGPPETKEEGRERWEEFLRRRFIAGRDEDFDYGPVDEDDSYDVLERRDEEDAWFNDEEPGWIEEGDDDMVKDKGKLEGETGIQDF